MAQEQLLDQPRGTGRPQATCNRTLWFCRIPEECSMQRLVAITEVTGFVQRCMEAVGAAGPHAASLADVLLAADTRGHYSHGLNRLGTHKTYVCVCVCLAFVDKKVGAL